MNTPSKESKAMYIQVNELNNIIDSIRKMNHPDADSIASCEIGYRNAVLKGSQGESIDEKSIALQKQIDYLKNEFEL